MAPKLSSPYLLLALFLGLVADPLVYTSSGQAGEKPVANSSGAAVRLFTEPPQPLVGMRVFVVYTVKNTSGADWVWPAHWDGKRFALTLKDNKGLVREVVVRNAATPTEEPVFAVANGGEFSDFIEVSKHLVGMAEGVISVNLVIDSDGTYLTVRRSKDGAVTASDVKAECWKGKLSAECTFEYRKPKTDVDVKVMEKLLGKALTTNEDIRTAFRQITKPPTDDRMLILEKLVEGSAYASMAKAHLLEIMDERFLGGGMYNPDALKAMRRYINDLEKSDCRVYREWAANEACLVRYFEGEKEKALEELDKIGSRNDVTGWHRLQSIGFVRFLQKEEQKRKSQEEERKNAKPLVAKDPAMEGQKNSGEAAGEQKRDGL